MTTSPPLKTLRFEALSEPRIPQILEVEKASNPLPWSENSFKHELTNPQSIFLLAINEGKVIGFAGVWLCIDEAHVTTIAVSPEFRRQGIGKKLMLQLLDKSVEAGMTCATLEVRASNKEAIAMYEALGFETVAQRKKYYPDNQETALIMWKHSLPKP